MSSKHRETQHRRSSYRRRSGESAFLFDSFAFVVRACFARRFGNQARQQGSEILQKIVVLLLNQKSSASAAAMQFNLRFPGDFYTGGLDLLPGESTEIQNDGSFEKHPKSLRGITW